jgi:hypothetical protein
LGTLNSVYNNLLLVKELVYDRCGFDFADFKNEVEGAAYGACTFRLNGMAITHRVSKITPAKAGQFVAIWKRNRKGLTEPFDISDDMDLVVISARRGSNFGQFVFPKSVLFEKGIMSGNNKEGKRGIRVYPPWDIAGNRQAYKTQQWQGMYFLGIPGTGLVDLTRAKELYSIARK